MDTVSREKRHEIMAKIRGKDTKIERDVRLWLYGKGIRYRKNNKKIIGSPDISIAKYKIAIFIHGCFWHGHEGCKNFRIPRTNREFWQKKIESNKLRDEKVLKMLENEGWKVFVIWECQLDHNFDETVKHLFEKICEIKTLKT